MSSIPQRTQLIHKYKSLATDGLGFNELALEIFKYQYHHNKVYHEYLDLLGVEIENIKTIEEIPALPIQFYKNLQVKSFDSEAELIFESSGTSGMQTSKHMVFDKKLYLHSCQTIFEDAFGNVEDFCFLALLPSYLERENSSLVTMIKHFISLSNYTESDFYLDDFNNLNKQVQKCKSDKIPVILFGVSFALLDFTESYDLNFPELVIIETGGMKGRKKEMLKVDIINNLREATSSLHVYSEYGMTELFSQFYALNGVIFDQSRYARIDSVQLNDAFTNQDAGKPGILKIIDLSNIDSCSFILTEDIGIKYEDDTFEILGRADNSVMRGCNLLYTG